MALSENKTITLHEDGLFGWDVTIFEDVTHIQYWEKADGKETRRNPVFEITSGYDVEVFKAVIKARDEVNG